MTPDEDPQPSPELARRRARVAELEGLINSPEVRDFLRGAEREIAHQRQRWSKHDAGKSPTDWYWLVGYLAGKALQAQLRGDVDKAAHHVISTAAALFHWHDRTLRDVAGLTPDNVYRMIALPSGYRLPIFRYTTPSGKKRWADAARNRWLRDKNMPGRWFSPESRQFGDSKKLLKF